MKRPLISFCVFFLLLAGCVAEEVVTITVSDPSENSHRNEMVEILASEIQERLSLEEGETFIVCNCSGEQIPYQLTYDGKLIFQVALAAQEKISFKVTRGVPEKFDTIACGQVYPDRMDDLAWENDKVAFRAYGPALQEMGEKGYGYDLFVKRGTHLPVLSDFYRSEIEMETVYHLSRLRKENPDSAVLVRQMKTYHIDRGYGMDCYAVGPTLGAGAAALMDEGRIIYPWCYREIEILDNGPLRFTARLVFTPFEFKGNDSVIEHRLITLDAGSHLNRTTVIYPAIREKNPIASGIVLHDRTLPILMEKEKGYIAYQDPTTGKDNGELYLGHVYDHRLHDAEILYFSDEERKERNHAYGHVLALDIYDPDKGFTYWWGFGWNRSDIASFHHWKEYLEETSRGLRNPLVITIN